MQIKVVFPDSNEWGQAVQLVSEKYRASYNAKVSPSPNCFLVCIRRDNGQEGTIAAAVGITYSESRRLFSENYLDDSVEATLSQITNTEVVRNEVIEVGSLASIQNQAGSELVRALPLICWTLGKKYVLVTATRQLRVMMAKFGMRFIPIASPNIDSLGEDARERWGSYYDQMPETGYVSLIEAAHNFSNHTGRYSFQNLAINVTSAQTLAAARASKTMSNNATNNVANNAANQEPHYAVA